MTEANGSDAAAGGAGGPRVPYEEWVSDVLCRLRGDEYGSLAEAEEELLADLDPVGEDDASGLAGVPWYVLGDADLEGRAKRLVHDLYAAAWRLPLWWDAGVVPEEGRPIVYEGSDGESYGLAVGLYGPADDRRAAFEEQFELRSLACSSPADLRALHVRVSAAVGERCRSGRRPALVDDRTAGTSPRPPSLGGDGMTGCETGEAREPTVLADHEIKGSAGPKAAPAPEVKIWVCRDLVGSDPRKTADAAERQARAWEEAKRLGAAAMDYEEDDRLLDWWFVLALEEAKEMLAVLAAEGHGPFVVDCGDELAADDLRTMGIGAVEGVVLDEGEGGIGR